MSDRHNNTIKRGLGRGLGSLLGNTQNFKEEKEALERASLSKHDFVEDVSSPSKKNMNIQNSQGNTSFKSEVDTQSFVFKERNRENKEIVNSHEKDQRIWDIAVDKILPHKKQPRQVFDKQKLLELSQSIKEKGILQPVIVRRRSENVFELIAGERRWRAAQQAGLHSVPAIIKEVKDQESLELALIENIQRHDLNPIDEAEAYQRLQNEYGLTQNQVAEKVGKDRTTVANALRLLALCVDVRNMLISGELSVGHAKVLLAITDFALQKKIAKKITSQNLTVRATEKLIKNHQTHRKPSDPQSITSLVQTLSNDLQKALGRKVDIDYKGGKGCLQIYFYSNDELNEISEKLKTAWN